MSLNRNRRWGVKGAEAPLGPPGPLGSLGYPWAPFLSLGRHPAGPYVFHFSSFAKGYQHSSKWKVLQLVVANANFRLASQNIFPFIITFHAKLLSIRNGFRIIPNGPGPIPSQGRRRRPWLLGSPWLPLAPLGPRGYRWVPSRWLPLVSFGSP